MKRSLHRRRRRPLLLDASLGEAGTSAQDRAEHIQIAESVRSSMKVDAGGRGFGCLCSFAGAPSEGGVRDLWTIASTREHRGSSFARSPRRGEGTEEEET
jgi:hypothetical protein